MDSLKFDLRLYVLVTCLEPLKIHVCKEGLVRFATNPYRPACSRNLKDVFCHLTNYSLNKLNDGFVHSEDEDGGAHGTKRTISSFFAHLEELGIDTEILWKRFEHIAEATMRALAPCLRLYGFQMGYPTISRGKCFHIFGFDILITDDMQCHLLELNARPSLSITSLHLLGENDHHLCQLTGLNREQLYANACHCADSDLPHIHTPSPVDKKIKSRAVLGALREVLETSICPMDDGELTHFGEYSTMYREVRCSLPIAVLELLCDIYIKTTHGRPLSSFMMRRLLAPFLRSLPKSRDSIKPSDVDTMWRVHEMRREKLKTHGLLRNFFDFTGFLQQVVEKANPSMTPAEALFKFTCTLIGSTKTHLPALTTTGH